MKEASNVASNLRRYRKKMRENFPISDSEFSFLHSFTRSAVTERDSKGRL